MSVIKGKKCTNNVQSSYGKFKRKAKEIFTIDFAKPLSLEDQMLIMFVILLISCLLFTLVYIFTLIRNENIIDTPSSTDISQIDISNTESSKPSDQSSGALSEEKNNIFKDTKVIMVEHHEIYKGDLILVNKKYECHSNGEETVSLMDVKTGSYVITDNTVRLNESIVDNLNKMLDDFEKLYGENDIMIACGYRSYTNQKELFDNEVGEAGEEEAAKWVARPGYSEHQTGLVFDFTLNTNHDIGGIKYDGTGIYQWINKNSYKYGFVLRYLLEKDDITGYSYEPWHFRYVGEAAANYITQNNLTLEEYMDTIQRYSIDTPLLINGDNNQWYSYYIPANATGMTEITVPSNYQYTISGDNYSGFIVTVDIN